MDLNSYVDKFGSFSFKERQFGDVDALILAQLSYINFDLIMPLLKDDKDFSLKLRDIPLAKIKELASDELTTKKNAPLLTALKSSLRFRNIEVKYIQKDSDIATNKQLFACTFKINNNFHYIAYRGTDLNLYAWKEDLSMSYIDCVPAQKGAIDYLNEVTSLFKGPYIIGGHSKGGNLAFYAALMQDKEHIDRTIKAYSFDGQGFYNYALFENEHFELIYPKLVKIVPKNCVIGIMLNDISHFEVVDAKSVGIFQHNPHNWIIDKESGNFKFVTRRTKSSYINELAVHNWVNSLSKEETILIVDVIFEYLGGLHLTLYSLINNIPRTISTFLKVQKGYDKKKKKKISSIYKRLFYYYRKAYSFYNSKEGKLELKKLSEEKKENARI